MYNNLNPSDNPESIELFLTIAGISPKDFLKSYIPKLCSYAKIRGVKESDIDDLVNDTLLAFLTQIKKHQNQGKLIEKPESYIYRIHHNTICKYLVGRKALYSLEDTDLESNCPISMQEDPEIIAQIKNEKLKEQQRIEDFESWANTLSEKEKLIIVYRKKGLKYEEISELINEKPATIRKTFSRIKTKWKNRN